MSSSSKITVGVLFGGQSTEHSVSCISARAVMDHLDPHKYDVVPIGITQQGQWSTGKVSEQRLPVVEKHEELALSINPTSAGLIRNLDTGQDYARVDVIFPVLHGPFGEDGTIQGLLELSGVPYVGTGVLSSACGMDKEYTKKLLAAEGLAVADGIVLSSAQGLDEAARERLGLPVFVKPARGGSSIGVSKVTQWEQLPAAIALALESDTKAIVEAQLKGDEVELGVLQHADGRIEVSRAAKLNGTEDSAEGFYGFATKYLDDVVSAQIPAPYDAATTAQLEKMARRAFAALDCRGLARVDFFLTADGPVINEVNTMPGFTPISMYPQVLADNYTFSELIDVLLEQALSSRCED